MSRGWIWRGRLGSRLVHPRAVWVGLLLAVACVGLLLVSMMLGKYPIGAGGVLDALAGRGDPRQGFIIEYLRLPRALLALLAGAALGLSGLLLQTLVRNPLASPDVLGMSSGASAAAVFFLSYLTPYLGQHWLPLFAIGGAAAATLAVQVLAITRRGPAAGASPTRLVLTGIAVSALMGACTTAMLASSPSTSTLSAYVWLVGSVFGATWPEVVSMVLWFLVLLPGLAWVGRAVPAYQLDELAARGVGVATGSLRLQLLALGVLFAGVAVAHAGAVAFVGLISPHVARRWVGQGFGGACVATALIGAMLVALADLVGRTLFLPKDIPAGIFVAVLGGAFFIYLLLRRLR